MHHVLSYSRSEQRWRHRSGRSERAARRAGRRPREAEDLGKEDQEQPEGRQAQELLQQLLQSQEPWAVVVELIQRESSKVCVAQNQ
jgi:endonuclease YncB( thermonuclease family)